MSDLAVCVHGTERSVPDRPCPLCAHLRLTALHCQLFAPIGADPDPSGYTLVACERCGFVFANIAQRQPALDESYRTVGRPTERPYDLERLEQTAYYLAAHLPRNARVLDAGCGTGALLRYLRDLGFRDCVGLDPSPAAIDRLVGHGFSGYVGSLSTPPACGTFDVIVLAHVLEHVRDLDVVLLALRRLLRADGVIYAEVPNAMLYADALFEPFHDINTEHINHFSPQSLALLFELNGFRAVETAQKWIECAPNTPYPATYGLWRAATNAGGARVQMRDEALVLSMEKYVSASTVLLLTMAQHLANALRGHDKIAIWGIGEFVQRLAWDTRFANKRVVAAVDGSEQRRGMQFEGVRIESPETLREVGSVPIVVGSVLQSAEIVRVAREKLKLGNSLITLHRPN